MERIYPRRRLAERGGGGEPLSPMWNHTQEASVLESILFSDWKKQDMKYLIAQGYPLIALGVRPPNWSKNEKYSGEGHYVVVVGYDESKSIYNVHDPNGGRRMEIPYDVFKDFHKSHPTNGNYVLCIYPKLK